MTDEHMDARLRAAGERWRTANDTSPGVDVAATVAAREPEVIAATPRRPRHWGLVASAAVVAAALVVGGAFALRGGTGTSNHPNTDSAGLVGTVWELVGYNNGPDLRDSSTATFYIGKDGQLVADDSCAVVGGKAQIGSGELTVTDQVVRYRGCTDTVGEMVFTNGGTKVLDGTADYRIDGNAMTISRAGTTMHLVAAPAGAPAPTLDVPTFVGAHWKLIKAAEANGAELPVGQDIPFFVDDTGKLTTSDGCNGLTARVTGIGQVRIEPGATTDVGCPTASVVRAVLNGTADESVAENVLTIRKPGAGELIYQWVPTDKAATDPSALDGGTWRLSSVVGEPAVSAAQLRIAGTTYTADDGCEEFTGHVSAQPGAIAFTGVPTTVEPSGKGADCSQEQVNQASTVDSLLSTGGLWSVRDGDLVIWDAASAQAFALVFTSGSAPPPPAPNPADALTGTTWYLDLIDPDVQALGRPETTTVTVTVTLTFDADGGVRLADSCDDADGTARITSKTIDFVDMQGETHSCPGGPGLTNYDHDVVWRVLDGLTNWTLAGAELTITKDQSKLVLRSPPSRAGRLFGHKWMLDNRESGNSGSYYDWAAGVRIPYLEFYDTGRFTGRDACVRLNGTVAVQGNTLSFGNINRYDSGCKNSDTPYFQDILTTDVAWTLSHGELRLSAHGVTLGLLGP